MKYLVEGRTTIVYELPLAELVNDFFDHLKSRSKGYASMEYNFMDYRQNDLVRLDVAINQEPVDALSCIVHKDKAYTVGKTLCGKLKEIVPRAQFKIPIQARVGAKIVASEQISALKKGTLEIAFPTHVCSIIVSICRRTDKNIHIDRMTALSFQLTLSLNDRCDG